jgi:TetR/AcrR family transcriptional regulator, transcriptional repressor for nem operon
VEAIVKNICAWNSAINRAGLPAAGTCPELARVDKKMNDHIFTALVSYKERMTPLIAGRRTADKERAFFAIFSTMAGAIEIARLLPKPEMREKVLASARELLLWSF